jgi:hypothetical protein
MFNKSIPERESQSILLNGAEDSGATILVQNPHLQVEI